MLRIKTEFINLSTDFKNKRINYKDITENQYEYYYKNGLSHIFEDLEDVDMYNFEDVDMKMKTGVDISYTNEPKKPKKK